MSPQPWGRPLRLGPAPGPAGPNATPQRRRRKSPAVRFDSVIAGATDESAPNALGLSFTSRSPGAERGASTTTGMPSLTALRYRIGSYGSCNETDEPRTPSTSLVFRI